MINPEWTLGLHGTWGQWLTLEKMNSLRSSPRLFWGSLPSQISLLPLSGDEKWKKNQGSAEPPSIETTWSFWRKKEVDRAAG